MSEEAPAGLDKLREDIDRIDRELHQLLRERAAVVRRIGLAKRTASGERAAFIRPGREAELMRGRIGDHDGALPAASVERIWREILSGACQMQAPFGVALYSPERSISHWDLVRNHFGSLTPIRLCASAQRVLQEVGQQNTIGVLPWPDHEEAQPWWPNLASEDARAVNIVSALPFYESATGRFESRRLMAVATYPPEPSSDDVSYMIVDTHPELSRTRLGALLNQAGLKGGVMATYGREGLMKQLLELDGFIGRQDERLGRLVGGSDGAITRAAVIGASARPLGVLDTE